MPVSSCDPCNQVVESMGWVLDQGYPLRHLYYYDRDDDVTFEVVESMTEEGFSLRMVSNFDVADPENGGRPYVVTHNPIELGPPSSYLSRIWLVSFLLQKDTQDYRCLFLGATMKQKE